MADMIARLKVDSSEYDAKIQRAAKGIQHLAEECHNAGSILNVLEDENREYIKSLGNMATVATTTRGKIAELTSGFIDIKSVYNSLSDEEKKGEFGKELNKQLDIMKGRITDAKKELADINKELEQTDTDGKKLGGVLDQLAGKFGISTKALTTWGAALAAGKLAIDTVKGAIESTEATHDTFAKTMAVADNVTNQFLRTLATADFSTFISGLQGIIDKTTQAYEAMDEFESYAARFQPWQSAKEGEIQTKLQQARAAKAQGDKQKAEQLTKEAKTLIDQLAASTKAYGEKQTAGGYATIRSLMGGVDITNGQIAWYADPRNWSEANRRAEEFSNTIERIEKLRKEANSGRRRGETVEGYSIRTGTAVFEQRRLEEYLKSNPQLKRAYTMMNLRDSGESKQAQAFKQALGNIYGNTLAESRIESLKARADRMEGTVLGLGSGTGKTAKTYDEGIKLGKGMEGLTGATIVTYESMEDLQRQLNAYKTALNRATNAIDEQAARQGIAATEWKMSDVGRSAAKLGWSQEDMTSEVAKMQDALGNIEPLKIEAHIEADTEGFAKDAADMAKEWNNAGSAIKAVGAAMSQIEDPAAKVMGTIAQAVATIALTFAESLKGTFTPWDWIAGAAAGTATMISTIAAIKSATSGGFANGGIIPGNSYSGDNLRGITPNGNVYGLNAGELILNKAQQNNLASDLQRNDQNGATAQPYVSGEHIYLGLNNYLKSSGRGEIVTSRR